MIYGGSLSKTGNLFEGLAPKPLAERLRPRTFKDVVGQQHLLGPQKPLRHIIENGPFVSMIFWGPPGCGKTTLAQSIAEHVNMTFEVVPATTSGVAELRQVFENAKNRRAQGQGTLLFVDEIHRFNRSQQDIFLSYLEDGTITLIGATTENPSFELNGALLSRARVFVLERLKEEDLEILLKRAEKLQARALPLTENARTLLKQLADGDGRTLLNFAEVLFSYPSKPLFDEKGLLEVIQRRAPLYDKKQEGHYNLISALHKSLRGSDVDAALYWFARMLEGGENPHYILRRLLRFASEDIGLSDPQALQQTIAAWQAYDFLGSPEGELSIAQAVVYLATAPKSNAIYRAFGKATAFSKETGSVMPPKHILNAPTKLMKDIGYGKDYKYDHDEKDTFSGQNYFPEKVPRQEFYSPKEIGFEREICKRLAYWQKLRQKRTKDT
jgi:putative ATPase